MAGRAITVQISQPRLRKLMRARRAATPSELINTLLAEEEERLRSHAVLRAAARTVCIGHVEPAQRRWSRSLLTLSGTAPDLPYPEEPSPAEPGPDLD